MISSISDARDEMFKMLSDAWLAADWSGVQGAVAPLIKWQGREYESPPPLQVPYARIKLVHAKGTQESLSDENGVRSWGRIGLIFVQCFGATPGGRALEDAEYMGQVAQRAYQGKQSESCIWFRNATVTEIGATDGWYQVNMVTQFDYTERR